MTLDKPADLPAHHAHPPEGSKDLKYTSHAQQIHTACWEISLAEKAKRLLCRQAITSSALTHLSQNTDNLAQQADRTEKLLKEAR